MSSSFSPRRGGAIKEPISVACIIQIRSGWPYVTSPFALSGIPDSLIRLSFNSFALIAIYKGTVNDPTSFPPSSKAHGSNHWAFERLLSASLVPITAAAVVTTGSQYPLVDAMLGLALIVHSHIGVSRPL